MLRLCTICSQQLVSGDLILDTARIITRCGTFNGVHMSKPHMEHFVHTGEEKYMHTSCAKELLETIGYTMGQHSNRLVEEQHES